jgi:hypothetical protein
MYFLLYIMLFKNEIETGKKEKQTHTHGRIFWFLDFFDKNVHLDPTDDLFQDLDPKLGAELRV